MKSSYGPQATALFISFATAELLRTYDIKHLEQYLEHNRHIYVFVAIIVSIITSRT